MKIHIAVFWVITLCILVGETHSFGEVYCPDSQDT
jgi:hypothetical protein